MPDLVLAAQTEAGFGDVPVYLAPKPFEPEVVTLTAPAGCTVLQVLLEAVNGGYLSADDLPGVEVYVDGVRLPREPASLQRELAPGEIVNIAVQVFGGRHGVGKILRTMAELAVAVVVGIYLGPQAGFAVFSAEQTIDRLIFKDKPSNSGSTDQSYSLDGAQNQQRIRQQFPLWLGQRRAPPDLVSSVYTTTVGTDVYLHIILGWHYGPCTVTDLKIGETLISAFEAGDVEFEHFLTPGPRSSSIYPMRVVQENYSGEIDHTSEDLTTHTSAIDAERLEFDLYWPGLYLINDKGKEEAIDSVVHLEYREVGDSGAWGTLGGAIGASLTEYATGAYRMHADSQDPLRATLSWTPPHKGQWEVRMHREPKTNTDAVDSVYWTALRTFENKPALLDQVLSVTYLKVKAGSEVNGALPPVTGVCTPIVPVWDGAAWAGDPAVYSAAWQPSSNAAALARYMMTGYPAAKPLTAGEIDASCADQYELIEAEGFLGAVLIQEDNVPQDNGLSRLGQLGRFWTYWNGARLCFVPDWSRASARQVFGGRNAKGYKKKRQFPEPVHAILVEFPNTEKDGLQDEITVYADGYNAGTATLIETMELKYACTYLRAHKEGAVYLTRRNLQVWSHDWTADIDSLVSTLGDRVLVEHKSALVAIQSARVSFRHFAGALVTGVRLDTDVPMEAGKFYALDVRRPDAALRGIVVVTTVGASRDLYFPTALAAADAPGEGDLVVFGEYNRVTRDVEIVDVSPAGDGSAALTAVPYIGDQIAQAYRTAEPTEGDEGGTIPPRSSFDYPAPVLLPPVVSSKSIQIPFSLPPNRAAPVHAFALQWRRSATPGNDPADWKSLPRLPLNSRLIETPPPSTIPTTPGTYTNEYDVRIRAGYGAAAYSAWAEAANITVTVEGRGSEADMLQAQETIPRYRVVRAAGANGVRVVDRTAKAQAHKVIGIAINDMDVNDTAAVQSSGRLRVAGASFVPAGKIWVGDDGVLTQTRPVGGAWIMRAGVAIDEELMRVKFSEALFV